MIVVTVFLSILNQMELHLVQNQMELPKRSGILPYLGIMENQLRTLPTSWHYCTEGFQEGGGGAAIWPPFCQRDLRLSGSRCRIFQSGWNRMCQILRKKNLLSLKEIGDAPLSNCVKFKLSHGLQCFFFLKIWHI